MNWKLTIPTIAVLSLTIAFAGCKKDDDPEPTPGGGGSQGPSLILKFAFDSTQVRLNEFGQPESVPAGNAAQSPRFNGMSGHYVEFTPSALTPLGAGDVVYTAPETNAGGANAIDFSQAVVAGEGEQFLNIPLSNLSAGTYEYLRVSLAYQNYDISLRINSPLVLDVPATLASFIGYNTYIGQLTIKDSTIAVNDDHLQGFWAFETPYIVTTGQAPGTTVPNPIFATSSVPAGSCVVTGEFPTALTITGNETSDVVIEVTLSTNQSFEWEDPDGDGLYEPADGESVVDMGIRGMIPTVQ